MICDADTIVAIATPPGRGGVGILRLSGSLSSVICQQILGRIPTPRFALYHPFLDEFGVPIDFGLTLYFPAPNSFTGEDVVEFHGHGGPIVLDLLINRILGLGARLAEAGEFSKRAFLNNKLDLAQVEAVADLINASTVDAAKSAMRSLSGEFSAAISALLEKVIALRVYVEAAIDFPDEEIDFLSDTSVRDRLVQILAALDTVMNASRQGSILNEGVRILILGQPNVGKSSLINALAGQEVAIVTDIAGTTRDLLKEKILIDGLPVEIVDSAGLRESVDLVEREGIRRAKTAALQADHILYVIDDTVGVSEIDKHYWQELDSKPITVILNKVEISGRGIGETSVAGKAGFAVSALTGTGIPELRRYLKQVVGFVNTPEQGIFLARRRHIDALSRTKSAVTRALEIYNSSRAGEFIAEELRLGQYALNEITGNFDNEALLDRIFSSFCIGK